MRKRGAEQRSEQLYGQGETTFEHQLGHFHKAVRQGHVEALIQRPSPALGQEVPFWIATKVVDQILEAAGTGILENESRDERIEIEFPSENYD